MGQTVKPQLHGPFSYSRAANVCTSHTHTPFVSDVALHLFSNKIRFFHHRLEHKIFLSVSWGRGCWRMETLGFLLGGDVRWLYERGWFCSSLLVDQRAEISSENASRGQGGGTRSAHLSMLHLASPTYGSFQVAQVRLSLMRASFLWKNTEKCPCIWKKIIQNAVGRLTPAPSPSPLHCWGKPPSLFRGSALTWQSPTAAPPVLAGSSSPLRRSAASICWQSAPPRRTGCHQTTTSRPAQSGNPLAQDVNNLAMTPARQQTLPYKRERAKLLCLGTLSAVQPELLPLWYSGWFQTQEHPLLLLQGTPPVADATL